MSKLNFGRCASLLVCALLFGCSGNSNSGSSSCSAFAACGGDPVGTWKVTGLCGESIPLTNTTGCSGTTAKIALTGATGSIIVNADSTESTDVIISATESANIPTSCYTSAQCNLFETTAAGTAGVTNASCSYSTSGGCSCSFTVTTHQVTTATYQVSGSKITVTATGQTPEVDSFCITGNQLLLKSTDANGNESVLTATK